MYEVDPRDIRKEALDCALKLATAVGTGDSDVVLADANKFMNFLSGKE